MIKGSPDSVKFEGGFYVLPNGERIAPQDARQSPDRDYYWCRYTETSPVIRPYEKHACLYVPGGGV